MAFRDTFEAIQELAYGQSFLPGKLQGKETNKSIGNSHIDITLFV